MHVNRVFFEPELIFGNECHPLNAYLIINLSAKFYGDFEDMAKFTLDHMVINGDIK